MKLPTQPDNTPTSLFNPDIKDFYCLFASDSGEKIAYTVPGLHIATFPAWLANKIAHKLAYSIVFKRGIKNNFEQDKQEVLQEIYVSL